jgi:hypothetical protein
LQIVHSSVIVSRSAFALFAIVLPVTRFFASPRGKVSLTDYGGTSVYTNVPP